MLVIGARGFAKEVLEVLYQLDWLEDLLFFDDINRDAPDKLYDRFAVLKDTSRAEEHFKEIDRRFVLGVGGPHTRHKLAMRFEGLGGVLTTVVSPRSNIGHFGTTIGTGAVVMTGAIITNDVTIGRGVLINKNCMIGHDSIIGDFSELSPGAYMGRATVGKFSFLGMGSVILPGMQIGDNAVVGAGAVVTRDVPSDMTVVGVPARPLAKSHAVVHS